MKKLLAFAGVAALAVAAVELSSLWPNDSAQPHIDSMSRKARSNEPSAASITTADSGHADPPSPASSPSSSAEPHHFEVPNAAEERSEDPMKMFKADRAGNLILGERTRLNVEKLIALYTPEERAQRLAAVEQALPASGYLQLVDLMQRYENFSRAARQSFPPGVAPSTVEEAITQHETLHDLRVAHFGAEATEAMYGTEERINRRLLDLMNLEIHAGLTLEERATKAQAIIASSPELAAAYGSSGASPADRDVHDSN